MVSIVSSSSSKDISPAQLNQVMDRVAQKNPNARAELIPMMNPVTGKELSKSGGVKITTGMATGRRLPISRGITTGTSGEVPEAWKSNIFHWGREDDQAMLLAFVNSAYEPGVGITGLQAGDWILVKEAARASATFANDKGAFGKKALISLLASTAQGALTGLALENWQTAIGPIIQTGKAIADEAYQGTHERAKRRDLYGRDPATGEFHRQEGGIVIVMPTDPSQDLNNIFSGNDSDKGKKRWIKKGGGPRISSLIPNHLHDVFFPVPVSCAL
jgi:hypothetical protein